MAITKVNDRMVAEIIDTICTSCAPTAYDDRHATPRQLDSSDASDQEDGDSSLSDASDIFDRQVSWMDLIDMFANCAAVNLDDLP